MFHYIPASYVYTASVTDDERQTLHDFYLQYVLENRHKESKDRSTVRTDFFDLDEGAWDLFGETLFPHFVAFLRECLTERGRYFVKFRPCWFNYYLKGTSMSFHSHADTDFGLVYCLKNESKVATLFDMFSNDWTTQANRYPKLTAGRFPWKPNPGDFTIFPGSLFHASDVAKTDGERITLSTNVLMRKSGARDNLSVSYESR